MASGEVRAESPINPDEGIPKPELGVFAKPVDTLVRPVSASASMLGQLAGALKEYNPLLEKVEDRFQQKAERQGETKAAEAFQKDQGDWDKAVANGDIPSILNPYARIRAREVFGRMAGDKMAQDIQSDQQYILDNENATTLQQHDAAVTAARARWEKEHLGHASHSDPIFQNQYQTISSAQIKDLRNRAVPEIEKNFVHLNGTHLADEISTHVDSLLTEGADSVEIQQQITSMLSAAKLPELVQRGAVNNAIDTIARKRNDTSVYDLAEGIQIKGFDGKSYKLATDPDFGKLRTSGRNEINRLELTETRLFNAKQLIHQNAVRAEVAGGILDALQDNPNAQVDLSAFQQKYRAEGLGTRIKEIDEIVAAARKQDPSVPEHIASLTADIRDPSLRPTNATYVNTATLIHALRANQISVDDYRKLQTMVDKRDKKGQTGRGVNVEDNTHIFDRWMAQTKNSFTPAVVSGSGIWKGDVQAAQNQAVYELSRDYESFLAKNPTAGPRELEKFLKEDLDFIRGFYLTGTPIPSTKGAKPNTGERPAPSIPDSE